MDLADRTAIVTGGAGGIGAAIVEHLRAAGATVDVWDLATGVDITDRPSVEAEVRSSGAVDVLGNAAGRVGSSGEAVHAGPRAHRQRLAGDERRPDDVVGGSLPSSAA